MAPKMALLGVISGLEMLENMKRVSFKSTWSKIDIKRIVIPPFWCYTPQPL